MDFFDKEADVTSGLEKYHDEYEATVMITNDYGLHARPAALVAQAAQKYSADIALVAQDRSVDAKSILDILSLAAGKGTTLIVRGKGYDARESVEAIAGLMRLQFHEDAR